MCNGTGIDTVAVTSFDHEWNKIKLENNWYNVDCTWDDNGSDNVGYTYFLRNDDYYDTSSSYSKKHHAEESYWEGYLPATEMDSVGSPWISVNENASGSKIVMSCYNKEAEIYYTTDKSNPVTSGTRMLYQSDFLWNSSEYPVIKAAAMEDGKHNSAVVTKCLHNYNASILADRRSNQTLHYEMIGATGRDHAKRVTGAVLLNGQMAGTGTGKSKKEAEQAAARAALQALQ